MSREIGRIIFSAAAIMLTSLPAIAETQLDWDELPPLPEPRSGHFAGVLDKALFVVGGSDFLTSPFQGGEKQWYADVFLYLPGYSVFSPEEKYPLSHPRAYGVSITEQQPTILGPGNGGGVLYMIGGSDGVQHFNTTASLDWFAIQGEIHVDDDALPPLPQPIAYMGGARLGDVIHIIGGQVSPDSTEALNTHYTLDLGDDDAEWGTGTFPGEGRILPVVTVQSGALYVFSGASLQADADGNATRTYLNDGYKFDGSEWTEITGPPTPIVAGSALPAGAAHILTFSGDTGEFATRTQELGDDHPGFPGIVYAYHTITDTWVHAADMPEALVTTTAVKYGDTFVIPAGEDRPGHRSDRVHRGTLTPTKGDFAPLDYAVIALYSVVLLAMGVYFSRRENTTEAFFLGGRRVPWWAVGISLFGTSLSAITYLTIPAVAFATDWILILNQFGVIIFAPLVVAYYIPKFREHPIATAYAYLESRFNVLLRVYGSLNFALFQIGRMSIVMFLPAIALSTATGVDLTYAIILMGVISTAYTVLGGIEAVIWTDVLQTFVLTAGAIIGFFIVFLNVDLGVGEAIAMASEAGKFRSFNWDLTLADATVWVIIIGSTLSNAYPITSDQTMVQRYFTTPDAKGAGRALWIHAWLAIPTAFLFFGLGTAIWVYFKENPNVLDPALLNDATLPLFIVAEFPAGLKGLIIASIFAATMSSLDSSINSLSSVVVTDYYRRFGRDVSDKSALGAARFFTIFFGTIGTLGALYLSTLETRSLFSSFLTFLNLVGGGVAGVFALGVLTKRGNAIGAFVGAVTSAVVVVYVWQATSLNGLGYGAVGFSTSLAVGYALSVATGGSKESAD